METESAISLEKPRGRVPGDVAQGDVRKTSRVPRCGDRKLTARGANTCANPLKQFIASLELRDRFAEPVAK